MEKPLILVTNDDGIDAEGIAALENALSAIGDVWTVAPATEQSAISHAITLWSPVRIHDHGAQRFAVTGTPTDCVYIALSRLLPRRPALCVSGVNHGANLGDDVIYSGTVAGAAEATLNDIPSIAVSLASYRARQFEDAAALATRLARGVLARGLPRGVFLNLNVPKSAAASDAIVPTKLGRRYYGKLVAEKADPRNKPYYWIGGSELGFDDIPGSDCNEIARDRVTVTPVQLDMTHYKFLRELGTWDELSYPLEENR
ncbi:MAG: 5'/3'-nucleotidase SurE [bacterium]